jgi:hypothetical protein
MSDFEKSVLYFSYREKYLGFAELLANVGLVSESGQWYRSRRAFFLKKWRKHCHDKPNRL